MSTPDPTSLGSTPVNPSPEVTSSAASTAPSPTAAPTAASVSPSPAPAKDKDEQLRLAREQAAREIANDKKAAAQEEQRIKEQESNKALENAKKDSIDTQADGLGGGPLSGLIAMVRRFQEKALEEKYKGEPGFISKKLSQAAQQLGAFIQERIDSLARKKPIDPSDPAAPPGPATPPSTGTPPSLGRPSGPVGATSRSTASAPVSQMSSSAPADQASQMSAPASSTTPPAAGAGDEDEDDQARPQGPSF